MRVEEGTTLREENWSLDIDIVVAKLEEITRSKIYMNGLNTKRKEKQKYFIGQSY